MNYEEATREADDLLRGAITDLKKPIEVPNYKKVDTSAFKKKVEQVDTQAETANLNVGLERENYNDAALREQNAITSEGAAKADAARADQARAQQEADLNKSIADAMGVNPDDLAAIGARIKEERPKAEAMLREVQAAQSVGLDNPLEWITGKLTIDSKIDAYNRQADIVNSLEGTLSDSLTTANAAAMFNGKSIPQITSAQSKARADEAVAQAAKLKAQAEEKLAIQNVTFAQQKLANDLAAAGVTKESTAQDLQQANSEFQAQIARIAAADTHTNRMLRAAELLEKLERTKQLEIVLKNYDRIMGNPEGTTNRYTFEKFSDLQRTNMVAIGAGSGGTDPYQALINLTGSGLRPGANFTSGRLLGNIRDWAAEIGASRDIQQLDEKQKPGMIAKKLAERMELEKQSAYKPGNIFYEASPTEMLLSGAVPKDSELAKVLEPFATQQQNVPTGVVISAIIEKWKNPSEAGAVISDYYKRNILLRNSSQNYKLVGVTPENTYKVPIKVGFLQTSIPFDLTKPEDATKMALFMLNSKQFNSGQVPQGFKDFRDSLRLPGTEWQPTPAQRAPATGE